MTLCEQVQRTIALRPDALALRMERDRVAITWREYGERVRRVAEGLAALGVRRGDALALLLTNRLEFNLVDAAALHVGAVPFSMYATSAPEQLDFLLRDSGARVVVTEKALLARLEASGAALDHVVVVDGRGGTTSLEAVEQRRLPSFDFEASWRAVGDGDVATLIYTSGTTGPPKGVEITHANVLAAWRATRSVWRDVSDGGRIVSYLPSAHIADRFSTHYAAMLYGHTITCCPDPRDVARLLPEVRPTQFAAVPRVWEKLKAGLEARPSSEPARERIGLDRCEVAVVAAAPTPLAVLEFFYGIDVRIAEVYGLSETTAVATMNPPQRPKLGTVGPPIPGVELRLGDDGEVLVRGDVVMRGYRNRPDLTVEAIDADGWLHTGDVGTLDDDGYLRIVDRKKELIINAAGKNMSPASIESVLRSASPLIGHACVVGDGRPFNVALLTLEPLAAAAFDGDVSAAVAAAVARANARLSRPEQIKRFRLLDGDWQPGGIELTPTMKLKRRAIAERYADDIEALYADAYMRST